MFSVTYMLPTKERPGFLKRALENLAIVKQPGDQAIVVVNDSNPESWRVAATSPVVDLPMRSDATDVMHVILDGLPEAKGDYLMFISDDDLLMPDGVVKARAALEARPDIDMLVSGGFIVYKNSLVPVCVPKGTGYATEVRHIANYGFGGLANLYRASAVRELKMLGPHPTHLFLDTRMGYIAVTGGAKVRFLRVPAYYHFSVKDDGINRSAYAKDFNGTAAIKRAMKREYGAGEYGPKPYESNPEWDGEFA